MHSILHVVHSAQPGGMPLILRTLIRRAPEGVANDVVFLEGGAAAEETAAAGARVAIVDAGRARQAWKAPRVVRRLRAAIRESRPAVVVSHVSKAHLYAALAADLEGAPCVWHQAELYTQKPVMHQLAGRLPVQAVICLSAFTTAEHRRRFPRAPLHTVHPGVEPQGEAREHTRSHDVVVGIVGRLQRWKRVELALRAMPAVLAAMPAARLRVVGAAAPTLDADYPDELAAEARALGVAHAVEFAGHAADPQAVLGGLDVLVHCADREPFGIVLVEAMLHGVPPVAPTSGGPPEIVRDGVDGLLVDPTDSAALAGAVVALARDPRRRTWMGAAGRERALERFTAERMAREMWTVIERVATAR